MQTQLKTMDLNKETAIRLWNKSFGKETKVLDFSGRTIVKGAYNQRSSKYGWNVDHILPQSKGGKTNDFNLICCHIITNDEKADKFPTFKANDNTFEIIKVENHYEIKAVSKKSNKSKPQDADNVNFMDSASGVRFFKKLKGIQNKPRFVGSVLISLTNISNTAVIDFIEKFLDKENISYELKQNYYSSETKIIAKNYNMPTKDDINNLLDKCVLLNTYLSTYFIEMRYISKFKICYRVDYYKEKTEMYIKSQDVRFDNSFGLFIMGSQKDNTLYINSLVIINSDAKDKVSENSSDVFTEYNYVYTKLAKNLEKEVSEN